MSKMGKKGRNRPNHALKYNHPLNHAVDLVYDILFLFSP